MADSVRFIKNMPDELVARARNVLGFHDAIQVILRELMKEVSMSRYKSVKLWADVQAEAEKLGITRGPDEVFSFDFTTDTFQVIKADPKAGG